MTAVGGSIESISLAGRIFSVAADADSNRKLGGWENGLEANGDGTNRIIKTRTGWLLDGLTVSIDDTRGDAEYLQDLQDAKTFFAVSITYASGVTYQGTGQIVGETQTSSQNTTASLSLGGQGRLTQQ
ncbi:hypothetical protein Scuro_03 [Acinetobacter phage Scuro]|nr:hypothetical protein Scuro_03 [Acinetobacter phage Scuro]